MKSTVLPSIKSTLQVLIDPPREAWKRLINRCRGVQDISVHEAHRLMAQGALMLDVREQAEYDAGHLSSSRLIPLGSLAHRMAELQPWQTRNIVVICHGGKRSATACRVLAQAGFTQTFNMAGGILAWKKANLPVAT